jgi:hypothetical protein
VIADDVEGSRFDVSFELSERPLHVAVRKLFWSNILQISRRGGRGHGPGFQHETVPTVLLLLIRRAIPQFLDILRLELISISCPLEFGGNPNNSRKVNRRLLKLIMIRADQGCLRHALHVHVDIETFLPDLVLYYPIVYPVFHSVDVVEDFLLALRPCFVELDD